MDRRLNARKSAVQNKGCGDGKSRAIGSPFPHLVLAPTNEYNLDATEECFWGVV
jgi:hypothetical protein